MLTAKGAKDREDGKGRETGRMVPHVFIRVYSRYSRLTLWLGLVATELGAESVELGVKRRILYTKEAKGAKEGNFSAVFASSCKIMEVVRRIIFPH